MTNKYSGIYRIINIDNHKVYIGSSINIRKRWLEHKRMLRNNNHDNNYLQKSWNKYGELSFKFEIIEAEIDFNELLDREQYYLNLYKFNKNKCYNICFVAGNMLGFKHSCESKNKMSKSRIGNKNSLGHKHDKKTITKMSNSHCGLTHDKTTIVKLIKNSKKQNLKTKKYKTTKLSNKLKNELINKYKTGNYSTRNLSKIYCVSKSTIWNIVRN